MKKILGGLFLFFMTAAGIACGFEQGGTLALMAGIVLCAGIVWFCYLIGPIITAIVSIFKEDEHS